jgi:PAS domain S-box-containing protein
MLVRIRAKNKLLKNYITERKQAEEALKKSIQLLSDTGEMAKVGGWELDLSTQEVSWTEEVSRIHGVEPGYKPKLEEALNFYAPESRPAVEETLKKAAETGEPYDLELLFIPSGSKDRIWVRAIGRAVYSGGKIVKLTGTFQNIDKYKRVEEALQESDEIFKQFMENSPNYVFFKNDKMQAIRLSSNYEKMLGKPMHELLGKTMDELFPSDLAKSMLADDLRVLNEGKQITVEEELNGRFYTTIKFPIFIEGKPRYLAGYTVDITARRQAEEALQKAHNQLEGQVVKRTKELQKANLKLQELDQLKSMFIASMSHELRTPLSFIAGFTDIILNGISGEINEEQIKQLTLVKNSSSHLLSLINDLIDINKIETGKVEIIIKEFDLSALSREIKDNFTVAAAKKGLELSLEVPPLLLIEGEERRTQQILVNLLSNALKFTARGGIKIKIVKKDQMVEIAVRDTGIGIRRREDMDKLFKPFSRVSGPGKIGEGTGLGLYLSKKNANLLGGDIMVESEFGKGSVFTLILPLKYKEDKV